MDPANFFFMEDESDLGLGPTSFAGCYDNLELENDPLDISFDIGSYSKSGLSPPVSLFYPQLGNYDFHPYSSRKIVPDDPDQKDFHNSYSSRKLLSEDSGDQEFELIEDGDELELIIEEKPEKPKYFMKTIKPKRRPENKSFLNNQCSLPGVSFKPNDMTNTSLNKQRKIFHCRSCGKSFKFQTSLLRHNNKVHISKYICPTCNRVFSRQAYLDVHTNKLGSSCYLGHFKKSK